MFNSLYFRILIPNRSVDFMIIELQFKRPISDNCSIFQSCLLHEHMYRAFYCASISLFLTAYLVSLYFLFKPSVVGRTLGLGLGWEKGKGCLRNRYA
jgi:hypothetical protein